MEHFSVFLTCIKLPHGFKTFVLSIFEWLFKTGFTIYINSITENIVVIILAKLIKVLFTVTNYLLSRIVMCKSVFFINLQSLKTIVLKIFLGVLELYTNLPL